MFEQIEKDEFFNEIKKSMKPILVAYISTNGEKGFFAELKEQYFPLIGIEFYHDLEYIDSKFCDTAYYLLENKKIAKFVTHADYGKDWLYTKNIERACKDKNGTSLIIELNNLIKSKENIEKKLKDVV